MWRRYPHLAVFALALFVGLGFQATRGLFESTEGRYALCALEMARSGDWLTPTLHGEPHLTKPPFTYWVLANSVRLLGPTTLAARLPIALAFVLNALLVMAIATRMWDRRTGLIAGIVYATSPFPAIVAFTVNTDTFAAFWQIAAAACYWQLDYGVPGRPIAATNGRWRLLMWSALGMAFFTKGLPAVLVLIPIVACHLAVRREPSGAGPRLRLFTVAGVSLFALLAFWWFAVVTLLHPEELSYFIMDEVVNRVATNKFGRNPEWYAPFKLYLPIVVFGAGLWSWYFWKSLAGWRGRAAWRPRRPTAEERPRFFLWMWLLPSLAIFSLSKSRLATYLLPCFTAIPLLAADTMTRLDVARVDRLVRRFAAVSAVAIVAFKGLSVFTDAPLKDMRALADVVEAYSVPHTACIALGFVHYNGLYYYLDAPVRSFEEEREMWGLVPRVRHPFASGAATRVVAVMEKRHMRLSERLRVAFGDAYSAHDEGNWYIVVVDRVGETESAKESAAPAGN